MSSTRDCQRAVSGKPSTLSKVFGWCRSKTGRGARYAVCGSTNPGRRPRAPRTAHLAPFFLALIFLAGTLPQARPELLFEERFEDSNFLRRGWYDVADGMFESVTPQEHAPGS